MRCRPKMRARDLKSPPSVSPTLSVHLSRMPSSEKSSVKLKLCHFVQRPGGCMLGNKCNFAHSVDELWVADLGSAAIAGDSLAEAHKRTSLNSEQEWLEQNDIALTPLASLCFAKLDGSDSNESTESTESGSPSESLDTPKFLAVTSV